MSLFRSKNGSGESLRTGLDAGKAQPCDVQYTKHAAEASTHVQDASGAYAMQVAHSTSRRVTQFTKT